MPTALFSNDRGTVLGGEGDEQGEHHHEEPGGVLIGYITLHSGSDVDPAVLRDWASARVPQPAAAPKDVHLIPEMPLTAVGKVYAPALRADATRRVVRTELDALGVTGDVRVDDTTLHTTVRAEREARPRVAAVLDRYAIDWSWDTC